MKFFRKPSGYWVLIVALTIGVALYVWFHGDGIDPSPLKRVGYVAVIGMFALTARTRVTGLWHTVVRRAPRDDARQHERDASARAATTDSDGGEVVARRRDDLESTLRHRYGWRWRSLMRWIAVVGDEARVKSVVPGLVDAGYVIAGDTVLIHAKQNRETLDDGWLKQIRQLRRRRPIDAIAALTHTSSTSAGAANGEVLAQTLTRHARTLRWAAPVYLIEVTNANVDAFDDADIVGETWRRMYQSGELAQSLHSLAGRLANAGVARLAHNPGDRYLAELSAHIERSCAVLCDLVARASESRLVQSSVQGLLFAPLTVKGAVIQLARQADVPAPADEQHTQLPLWTTIAAHSRTVRGRRVGFSWSTTAAWATIVVAAIWLLGSMISGGANRSSMREIAATLNSASSAQDATQTLLALDTLDKQLDTLEAHRKDGAPLYTRFGLNHDAALYNALWPAYQNAASRVLIEPIKARLEERLQQLASLSDAEIASGGHTQVQAAYDTLKTYLMLAHPEHADAAFLTTQLLATNAPARPLNASITQGTWEDLRQHAIAFYASQLKHDAAPEITPDVALVASARQTIIGVRGLQNSTDAIYQQIIEETKPKYPPITLATLLGDHPSRGLFNTMATVPGVFTRAAWDERIPKAIDEASEQRTVTGDWVLSDAKIDNTAPSTLKAELRQRYFDDYARAWAQFLNSIRWQNASSLSGTVDQLTLLGDPQRSPLVALMNAIVYQASAGASTQSLSDNLLSKAQSWVGKDEKDPSKQAQPQRAPLASAFGPIVRLTGADLANAKAATQVATLGDLSLPRYLERVTAMRLKTQQMMQSADPDAMSRAAAQAVLQGKTSDLADSRDYASRLAASLGEQWSGFGKLFEAPLDQTWQVVVQPAASSLNDIWRTSVLADWNRTFDGRYPFADSDNDASLPDMANFMRTNNGVIAQFVTTQLAGVIERQGNQWVAAQGADHGGLTLDPAFLAALNKLTRLSTVLFPSGDARVRFELRGVPTPGITDMKLVASGQQLHYFNQMEQWVPFEWPGQALDNNAQLQWQTDEGGLRSTMYAQGRFALIRLFERAKVSQQDNARYVLSWTPDQGMSPPLSVQVRAEAGAGPLDVLQLRHFTLPTRIFVTKTVAEKPTGPTPPPLPPGALAAAKTVGVPLPESK